MYFLYMIECRNNSYYTGYTTDMQRRYQEHLNGTAKCKYTRSFPPQRLAVCWQIDAALADVLRLEQKIKQLNRAHKENLIQQPQQLATLFDDGSSFTFNTHFLQDAG